MLEAYNKVILIWQKFCAQIAGFCDAVDAISWFEFVFIVSLNNFVRSTWTPATGTDSFFLCCGYKKWAEERKMKKSIDLVL